MGCSLRNALGQQEEPVRRTENKHQVEENQEHELFSWQCIKEVGWSPVSDIPDQSSEITDDYWV